MKSKFIQYAITEAERIWSYYDEASFNNPESEFFKNKEEEAWNDLKELDSLYDEAIKNE